MVVIGTFHLWIALDGTEKKGSMMLYVVRQTGMFHCKVESEQRDLGSHKYIIV